MREVAQIEDQHGAGRTVQLISGPAPVPRASVGSRVLPENTGVLKTIIDAPSETGIEDDNYEVDIGQVLEISTIRIPHKLVKVVVDFDVTH